MIVEVFFKGTFFTRQYNTFWNVKKITRDGNNFILEFDKNINSNYSTETVMLPVEDFELRCTY